MHTQINTPAKSVSRILPQQGNTNTFQKVKSKEEILGHYSIVKTMNYKQTYNRKYLLNKL